MTKTVLRPVRRLRLALLSVAVMATAAFAPSPAPSPIDDPEAKLSHDFAGGGSSVSTLVVRPPGPAWWTVSRGPRKVYILGVLWPFPANEEWSEITLDRHLSTADRVLMPAVVSGEDQTKPDTAAAPAALPPELAARLKAAAIKIGAPPERYLNRRPLEAGMLLVQDFRTSLGAKSGTIVQTVQTIAQSRGRFLTFAAVIQAENYTASLDKATPEAQRACLEAALDEVEGGADPLRDAFEGWAGGDVRAALKAPRAMEHCSFAIPQQANLRRRTTEAEAGAIVSALQLVRSGSNPGLNNAVAVVNLRTLLAEGGVLDQLRAKGYQIDAPEF